MPVDHPVHMNGVHSPATMPSRASPAGNGNCNGFMNEFPDTDEVTIDGDMDNDIAICGFSIKFPQEATTADAFWELMMQRRCAMTDFPPSRVNKDGFCQGSGGKAKMNTFPVSGGHFFQEDPALFDADFFSISPAEAVSMDPMQRWLLEAAYRALENAGMPLESVLGSSTGIYTGSFSVDYMLQLARDAECSPMYAAVGFGLSMLANRISWFFNLRGPSIALDSACSSTAMAIDIACQALRNGSCNMAVVAGSNMATAPEGYVWMSNINFLSPDSRCYSFDSRGNGYARGEGVAVVILKRLRDAVRDGNTIRAVIRATGSNEDGKTPGITQPSRQAQERLIRDTYAKSGLSMQPTRFFEAHGTGTAIGDPFEAQAAGSAFRQSRHKVDDPLYLGAVKSNIGHLEGASGLAGLVKAVLVLERGIIPPNANFEKLNPKIDAEFLRLKIPERAYPWPEQGSGLRRASISSFGFGGANSHMVVDDAYNYLRLRGLRGRHCTTVRPRLEGIRGISNGNSNGTTHSSQYQSPKLLIWSAADKAGIDRIAASYQAHDWARTMSESCSSSSAPSFLSDLAFTLDTHRTHLPWRSWAIIRSPVTELPTIGKHLSVPVRAAASTSTSSSSTNSTQVKVGYVFSGQGAQWHAMGRDLVNLVPSFGRELQCAEEYLRQELGCCWSVMDELDRDSESSRVHDAELSQPLCTILQVALVNLLRRCGVGPSAVVGHSSGEIAAAYAGGYLTAESAWRLAYFRGVCSAELVARSRGNMNAAQATQNGHGYQHDLVPPGAMLSVGLPQDKAQELIDGFNRQYEAAETATPNDTRPNKHFFGITIGCINSPTNVTISGEERLIDQLSSHLQTSKPDVFTRKLRVPLAYHSAQMELISSRYKSMIGSLDRPFASPSSTVIPMISSVTGKVIHEPKRLLDPAYWVLNMTSPVRFSEAVACMCAHSVDAVAKKIDLGHRFVPVVDHLVEVGPHATLQGPIRDILGQAITRELKQNGSGLQAAVGNVSSRSIEYINLLRRGETSALESVLGAMGRLLCLGVTVNLRAANTMAQDSDDDDIDDGTSSSGQSPCMLTSLPEYPFDHSRGYWHEGRLSKNYRLREHPPCEFLGVRDRNWDPADARWQHFIRFSEVPWAEQHVIDGSVLYPGTGMLAMAVEGARQLVEDQLVIRNKSSETVPGYVIDGYSLSDVRFQAPLTLSPGSTGTEVQTCLRRVPRDGEERGKNEEAATMYEFSIRTPPASTGDNLKGIVGEWTVNCRGFVSVQVVQKASGGHGQDWEGEQTRVRRRKMAETMSNTVSQMNDSMQPVDASKMYTFLREQCGYDYGPDFQALQDQHCLDPTNKLRGAKHDLTATAHVSLRREQEQQQPVFHPATLDAILHLCFTAFSSGGTRPMATSIPSHISRMWISSRGLGWSPDAESVLATSSIATEGSRGFTARGGAFRVGGGSLSGNTASACSKPSVGTELALWYEGLELTAVGRIKSSSPSSSATPGVNPRQWFMNVDCKADVGKLTPQEVVSMLGDQEKEDCQQVEEMSRLVPKLEELIQASLQSLERLIVQNPSLLQAEQDCSSSWRWRYWNWARHHYLGKSSSGSKDQPDEKLQRLLSDIEPQHHPIGRVFTTVAKNLPAIFQGAIDPLQLLVHSGLLKDYYKELANYRCSRQAGRYMDLLAHQNPGMDILEVGGGTGSATRRMLHALAMPTTTGDSLSPRHLRCRLYHFTDISGAFAEAARDEFVPLYHPGQLAFSRLNIENDPLEQGFGGSDSDAARYDVIVADNVIHATADLRVTLRNLRKLLKPGGRLLMHEPLRPDGGGLLGFVFGLFPGWWLGGEGDDGGGVSRLLSPTLPTDAWHGLLRVNGFSGVDMRFKDFDDEALHHLGWIVSVATNSQELSNGRNGTRGGSPIRSGFATKTIILDKTCQDQVMLADRLATSMSSVDCGMEMVVELLDMNHDSMTAPDSTKLTILLSDYGTPFLRLADKPSWTRLKQIFRTTRHLLWVSSNSASSSNSGDITTTHPDQGLIDGLARSLRAEYYELHLVTLCLAAAPSPLVPSTIDSATRFIAQIASEMTQRSSLSDPYEQEYLESNGRLHTRRLVEAAAVKSAINATLVPHRLVSMSGRPGNYHSSSSGPKDDGEPLEICLRLPGSGGSTTGLEPELKATPFFVPSKSENMVLTPDSAAAACGDDLESAAAPSANILLRAIQIRPYHINSNGSSQGNTSNPEAAVPSFYCTGIVSNINNTDPPSPRSDSPVLKPGDRVFGIIKATSLTASDVLSATSLGSTAPRDSSFPLHPRPTTVISTKPCNIPLNQLVKVHGLEEDAAHDQLSLAGCTTPKSPSFADACTNASFLTTGYRVLAAIGRAAIPTKKDQDNITNKRRKISQHKRRRILLRNPATCQAAHAALVVLLLLAQQEQQENHQSNGKKLPSLDGLEIWTTASDGHERDWIVEHFAGLLNRGRGTTSKFDEGDVRVLPDGWFQGRNGPPLVETRFDFVLSRGLEDKMRLESCMGRYLADGCRVVNVCNQLEPSAASYGDSFWCQGGGKRDISIGYLSMDDLELVDNDALGFAATHCLDRDMDSELLLPKWQAEEEDTTITNPGRRLLAHVPRHFMASEATAAFEHLNKSDGESAGVVLEFGETDEIKVRVKNEVQHDTLDPSGAYLIAGGLGGIGRFIASWMVSRGARYLILLSRSGPTTPDSQTFLAEMASRGVHVEAPCCDITNTKMLRSVLDDCATRMPPVKGCVQSVMVMKELILEKMEFEDWQAAVDGKVAGSWNLYQELLVRCCRSDGDGDLAPLDFFLFVSSMMGTIGGSSLSAYSAANSYMDALARYMVGQGHRAASIALGIVPDVGWLTDHTERLDAMSGVQKYAYTERNEIQALLEIFCRGHTPRDENDAFSMTWVDSGGLLTSHTVTGVRPPSHWQEAEEVPFNMAQPLWGHMHHIPPLLLDSPDDDDGSVEQNNNQPHNRAGRERAQDAKARIRSAASISEAAEVAGEALVQRIASLLGAGNVVGGEKLDHRDLDGWQKPLHSYGIDSLSAIEIRSWVARVFDVDLAVFDILGGATVASCAMTIAAKVYGSVISHGKDESRS